MKKQLLVAGISILAASSNLSAQSSSSGSANNLHFGARAGVNISNLVTDDKTSTTGSKAGLNLAVLLEIPIVPAFSVQPEVQFSQKGFKRSGNFLTAPYEYKLTSNFIEVPLLAKIRPSKNFAILVGPQYSFLVSTKTKFNVSNSGYESLVKQDVDNFRKNILGGVVGIEVSSGPLFFDLRYSRDFQNNNGDGTSSTPKYKNQVAALSVGLRF